MINNIESGNGLHHVIESGPKPEVRFKSLLDQALNFLNQHDFSVTSDQVERIVDIIGGGQPDNVVKNGRWQIEVTDKGLLVTIDTETGKEEYLFK